MASTRKRLWITALMVTRTAYRGHARVFLKDLEAIRPSAIIDIIHSGETFQLDEDVKSGMKALRKGLQGRVDAGCLPLRYRKLSPLWIHQLE